MDYEMPIMNGLEATKLLMTKMNDGLLKEIPIVALTAYTDEKKACLQAGMKQFLTKPATVESISEVLEDLQNGKL